MNDNEACFMNEDDNLSNEESFRPRNYTNKPSTNLFTYNLNQNLSFGLNSLVDLEQLFKNQIVAAKVAESTLIDLESETKNKYAEISMMSDYQKKMESQLIDITKERDDIKKKVDLIQTENN